jgi:predicted DNA binding protein
MNTIAEFHVPAENFALSATLATLDVNFEAERVTAYDTDRVLPLLWATGGPEDLDALGEELGADPSVENAELVTSLDDEELYRMEWVRDVRFVVHILVEEDAAILGASGSREFWRFRALFPDRESVGATHDFCERWDLGVTLNSIYEMNAERYGRYGLTMEQSEALVVALAAGYFDVPRGVTMDDLAAELGVSRQAVSERLRRAHKGLIRNTMAIGHRADAERKNSQGIAAVAARSGFVIERGAPVNLSSNHTNASGRDRACT